MEGGGGSRSRTRPGGGLGGAWERAGGHGGGGRGGGGREQGRHDGWPMAGGGRESNPPPSPRTIPTSPYDLLEVN